MKIILTGALGHVGINVLNILREKTDIGITCLVLPNEDISRIKHDNINFVKGDIRDEKLINELIEKDDVVIHLAGIIEIGKGKEELVMSVNYMGTKIVSEACFNKGARLTYISSVHTLEANKKGKIDENCRLNIDAKRGIYEESKSKATEYVYDLIEKGLDARIVFPSAIIGPYDYKVGEITGALYMLYQGKIPFYIKGGYSFVDVRDVARCIYEITFNGQKGDKCIVSNRYISIKELMELSDKVNNKKHFRLYCPIPLVYIGIPFLSLHAKINKRKPIFTKTMLETVLSNGDFDNSKMKEKYNIEPIDLAQSIKDTIDFINSLSSNLD